MMIYNRTYVNLRHTIEQTISLPSLKRAVENGEGQSMIRPFDEITIPLTDGGTAVAVCGYVDDHMARFVLKDCLWASYMNERDTNAGGYAKSYARQYVLESIYPLFPDDLKDIITPRRLDDGINREICVDPIWIPSATDVFGPSVDGERWAAEPLDFQLPIFERPRDRVKEYCGDTVLWWLRSPTPTNATNFRTVSGNGGNGGVNSSISRGLAPGFDI